MQKDYDRTICNTCDVKTQCNDYRNKFLCVKCERTLACFAQRSISYKRCGKAVEMWRTLPLDCALVSEVMRNHLSRTSLQPGSLAYIMKGYNYLCPRCLQPTCVLYPAVLPHGVIDPLFVKLYVHNCAICKVNVAIQRET